MLVFICNTLIFLAITHPDVLPKLTHHCCNSVSPGGHHDHTILPAGPEVDILLEHQRGAPGSQAAGLEVVGPEEAVALGLEAPDVESVGHAGARLVSLVINYY